MWGNVDEEAHAPLFVPDGQGDACSPALQLGDDMTVVFDALFASGEEHREQAAPHFEIIYTGEGVTADSCIERLAYESVRASREVHVVTSDGAEQSAILGAGAYRISSAELWRRVKRTKKKIADE